jgi:hypothetical protein
MIAVAAIVALVTRLAPSVGQVRAAIWSDIASNATIGNYNELISWDWYYGVDRNHPPTLTIVGLKCDDVHPYRCAFDLTRQPDQAASADDKAQPGQLSCTASFKWSADDRRWVVIHLRPPKGGGHTRTSMQCQRRKY